MMSSSRLSISVILAFLLAGCSGAGRAPGEVVAGSGQSAARASFSDARAIPAAARPGELGHYHGVRVTGLGGTIEYKPFGKYHVAMPYAPNSLGKKHAIAIVGYEDRWLGYEYPNAESGFTVDWQGVFILNYASITFGNDKLTMAISGAGLNPSFTYTLFLYTSVPGFGWQLLSRLPLGVPVNGALSAPSVFENGFTAPQGYTLLSLEH